MSSKPQQPDGIDQELDDDSHTKSRYLLFKVGKEVFGTPLLQVREIVKPQPLKLVPNTVDHFKGIINLRGEVVGVIDLGEKFGIEPHPSSIDQALIVFDTKMGPLATVVDYIESVSHIPDQDIETDPAIYSHVPLDYLIGVGKMDGQLIYLVTLQSVLRDEELLRTKRETSDVLERQKEAG